MGTHKSIFLKLLFIGCGGCLGAITRYLSGNAVNKLFSAQLIPYGTLFVNIAGCFIIGLIYGVSRHLMGTNSTASLFLITGFLGSFTTFSTFGLESFRLLENGKLLFFVMNILLHVTLGIIAVYAGAMFGKDI